MKMKQIFKDQPWKIIIILGVFALIRPMIKIFGEIYDYEVSPASTLIITAAIAMTWIVTAVYKEFNKPVVTLALCGAVYGFTSILLAATIQLTVSSLHSDEVTVPVLLTAGLIATTLFNFVYGAILGLIALGLQKIRH